MIDSSDNLYDVIIVGGGLAGLTAAWNLREKKILLIESETRFGGRIYSSPRDSYWLNLGAGVFSAGESPLRNMINSFGLQTIAIPGSTTAMAFDDRILSRGRIETYPLRLPLSLSARKSLIFSGIKIRSAVAKYHKVSKPISGESIEDTERRIMKFEGDRSFADFLGRIHPDVDAILRATAANRLGAELETISANGALGSFAYQWDKSSNILNHNLIGGSAKLTDELSKRLGKVLISSGTVERVIDNNGVISVTYQKEGKQVHVKAKAAIVATPADVSRKIISNLPTKLENALGEIRYGPAVLASVLTDETGAMPYDNIYAMITPKRASTVFINVANSLRSTAERKPGGSLLVYKGGPEALKLMALSDKEVEKTLLNSLFEVYPSTRGIIREVILKRWERIVPFSHPGRYLIQSDLEIPMPRIFLAGDYLGNWANMEVAFASGTQAAKMALAII